MTELTKSTALDRAAGEIGASFEGFGQMMIWGGMAIQPYDAYYRLREVGAVRGCLRLELDAGQGATIELIIVEPQEISLSAGSLTILRAKSIRFGQSTYSETPGDKRPALVLN